MGDLFSNLGLGFQVTADALARCRGLDAAEAEGLFTGHEGTPALAFWVTAVRELLEESGIMLACDKDGRAFDPAAAKTRDAIERCRKALMAGEAPFIELMAREGWYCDLHALRYLCHFITPTSSQSDRKGAAPRPGCKGVAKTETVHEHIDFYRQRSGHRDSQAKIL